MLLFVFRQHKGSAPRGRSSIFSTTGARVSTKAARLSERGRVFNEREGGGNLWSSLPLHGATGRRDQQGQGGEKSARVASGREGSCPGVIAENPLTPYSQGWRSGVDARIVSTQKKPRQPPLCYRRLARSLFNFFPRRCRDANTPHGVLAVKNHQNEKTTLNYLLCLCVL